MAVMVVVAAGGTRDWGRKLSFPCPPRLRFPRRWPLGNMPPVTWLVYLVGSENDAHGPLWWVCGLG